MKAIETINFKGGVGKTTCTWALGHVAANSPSISSLVSDLDAQMSLTHSIALNEDGNPFRNFTDWFDRSVAKNKAIFNALDEFTKTNSKLEFGINNDFVYRINDRYHFIPSVEDLYWTELEVWDREKVKVLCPTSVGRFADANNLNVTSKTPKQKVMLLIAGRFRERRQLIRTHFNRQPPTE